MENSEGAFISTLSIVVRDLNHLESLVRKLSSVKGIYSVNRLDSKI
jgi:(p)ppGpp synthase/HD superfamily hydrolase